MKGCLALAVLFVAAGPGRSADDNSETLARELLTNGQEAIKVLHAIQDRKMAEEARPKLELLGKKQREIEKRRQDLADAHPDQVKELPKRVTDGIKNLWRDLDDERARLDKVSGALAVLKETYPFPDLESHKTDVVRAQLKLLSDENDKYKLRTDNYPDSLKQLTEGDAPVSAEGLIDPWGRPYQYDVSGRRNQGRKPDIWSQGPNPKDPKSVVGNWEEKADKP